MEPKETVANQEMVSEQSKILSALETSRVLTREDDWYRVHSFEALPENISDRIAKLEQDDHGIRVKFFNQSELDAAVKELKIPTM